LVFDDAPRGIEELKYVHDHDDEPPRIPDWLFDSGDGEQPFKEEDEGDERIHISEIPGELHRVQTLTPEDCYRRSSLTPASPTSTNLT
jgi:hypothetical protein